MRNLYYQLWVDGIVNSKDYKNNESGWKFSIYWLLTVLNGLNVAVLFIWLDFFEIDTYRFHFNENYNSTLLNFVEGFLNYVAPIAVINYYLIFHKDRYKRLIIKYSHFKGRYALYYSIISLMILVGTVILTW